MLIRHLQKTFLDATRHEERHRGRARFSPGHSFGRHFGPPHCEAREASVMLAIVVDLKAGAVLESGDIERAYATIMDGFIPLTLRSSKLPSHPGQISLPGGRIEASETPLDAAKREFHEELGVEFDGAIVGELLPLFVYNSNHFVHPFVVIDFEHRPYVPCEHEVERIIRLPIKHLMQPANHGWSTFSRGRSIWKAPVIRFDGDEIWGATAILLGEFATVLQIASRSWVRKT